MLRLHVTMTRMSRSVGSALGSHSPLLLNSQPGLSPSKSHNTYWSSPMNANIFFFYSERGSSRLMLCMHGFFFSCVTSEVYVLKDFIFPFVESAWEKL